MIAADVDGASMRLARCPRGSALIGFLRVFSGDPVRLGTENSHVQSMPDTALLSSNAGLRRRNSLSQRERRPGLLKEAFGAHAERLVMSNDHMVVEDDVEALKRCVDPNRGFNVAVAWRWIVGEMIMGQDDRMGSTA